MTTESKKRKPTKQDSDERENDRRFIEQTATPQGFAWLMHSAN